MRSSGQFSHLVLRMCEERKIEKSKNKSIEVSARHTKPGDCPRQFRGNKGGTTPENLFPAALRAAFKVPLLEKFKRLKENLKRVYKRLFDFQRKKDHRKRGPVTKYFDICPRGQLHRDESFDFRLTRS